MISRLKSLFKHPYTRTAVLGGAMSYLLGSILKYGLYPVRDATDLALFGARLAAATALSFAAFYPVANTYCKRKRIESPHDAWYVRHPRKAALAGAALLGAYGESFGIPYIGTSAPLMSWIAAHTAVVGVSAMTFPGFYTAIAIFRNYRPPHIANFLRLQYHFAKRKGPLDAADVETVERFSADVAVRATARAQQRAESGSLDELLELETHMPLGNATSRFLWKHVVVPGRQRDSITEKIIHQKNCLVADPKNVATLAVELLSKPLDDGAYAFEVEVLSHCKQPTEQYVPDLVKRLKKYPVNKEYTTGACKVYSLDATFLGQRYMLKENASPAEDRRTRHVRDQLGKHAPLVIGYYDGCLITRHILGHALSRQDVTAAQLVMDRMHALAPTKDFSVVDYYLIYHTALARIGCTSKGSFDFSSLSCNALVHNNLHPQNILVERYPVVIDFEDSGRGMDTMDLAEMLGFFHQYSELAQPPHGVCNLVVAAKHYGRCITYGLDHRSWWKEQLTRANAAIKPHHPELCVQ